MKASELLSKALENYKINSFMCHELDYLEAQGEGRSEAHLYLHNKIHNLLAPHSTIVLHNLLRYTNKKYEGYNTRYGHNCKACYKMRVAFWQDMIAELKAEGL